MYTQTITQDDWDFDSPWLPGTRLVVFDDGCVDAFDSAGHPVGGRAAVAGCDPSTHLRNLVQLAGLGSPAVSDVAQKYSRLLEIHDATFVPMRRRRDRVRAWLGRNILDSDVVCSCLFVVCAFGVVTLTFWVASLLGESLW